MGDAADDLALQESDYAYVPDGTWYVHTYKGVKYEFRTLGEANEWAKSKGFIFAPHPKKNHKGEV